MSCPMYSTKSVVIGLVLNFASNLFALNRVMLVPGVPVPLFESLEGRFNPLLSA